MEMKIKMFDYELNYPLLNTFVKERANLFLNYSLHREYAIEPSLAELEIHIPDSIDAKEKAKILQEIAALTTITPAERLGWKVGDYAILTANGHTAADVMVFDENYGTMECSFYNITSDEYMLLNLNDVTRLDVILSEVEDYKKRVKREAAEDKQ